MYLFYFISNKNQIKINRGCYIDIYGEINTYAYASWRRVVVNFYQQFESNDMISQLDYEKLF